ncbi:MAG: aldo/keto reductase, partial [SAR324 cluster bacterium]|nr:aldo/keto reductase [SAR324 cluster bacterium]
RRRGDGPRLLVVDQFPPGPFEPITEIDVLPAVALEPLVEAADLGEQDRRHILPRFAPENSAQNIGLVETLNGIANDLGCKPAQVALAWVLSRGDDIVPIPGTKRRTRLVFTTEDPGESTSFTLVGKEISPQMDRTLVVSGVELRPELN